MLITCLIMLFLTLTIYIGSYIVARKFEKASLLTFVLLFFIFSFGPVVSPLIKNLSYGQLIYFYPKFFTFWFLFFSTIVVLVLFTGNRLYIATRFLAFVSVLLVSISVLRIIILYPWNNIGIENTKKGTEAVLAARNSRDSTDLPDIYYIILDRYLGSDILEKNYGFDNSPFLDYLRKKGFYVADKSRSNYLKTAHSLASSLNMEYVNYLSAEVGETSNNWLPLYKLIEENKVTKILKLSG
jgi:hypothetical protein